MSNVLPSLSRNWHPAVRHFSIDSKWLYQEDSRFDATTYAQEGHSALRRVQECRCPKMPLGDLVGRVYHPTENQARSNFKRIWVKPGEGPPFLSGKQLFFFRPDREKFLSRKMPKLDELCVPKGTILLSRSGSTGFPVLVGKWLEQFALTDDAIRIFPGAEPIGFIYAFLASSIGSALMVKSEYGSTVSHLEAKHITTIPVPLIPQTYRLAIHEKIGRAYNLRDQANDLLDEADQKMHKLLGVPLFTEDEIEYLGGKDDPRAFTISSIDLGERLDATRHVPLARSVVRKLQEGLFPLVNLGDRVDDVYVAPRFERIYVENEFGTPLLQGSHVPTMRIHDLKYISNKQTVKMDRWIIRKGWVLVTCSGTIGRVAIVTSKQDGWAASQHILRIKPKDSNSHPGFLATFLTTPFGQHQLQAKIYGGVVDELTAEDTAPIQIPDVPYNEQIETGELFVRAYELRDAANDLEDEAIAEVESHIK